jgi:hypothetical protein
VRVTAWAAPLPLEKAPYQAAPPSVLRWLFGALDSTSNALVPPLSPKTRVIWLPLDARHGLAHAGQDVFMFTLEATGDEAVTSGYRLAHTPHLSLTPRGPVTRLELGAFSSNVRTKVARSAVQLLGLTRLARTSESATLPISQWHAPGTPWTQALLSAHVRPTELVIAFLPLPLTVRVSSALLGEVNAPAYLLVTPQRIGLVAAALTGELYLPNATTEADDSGRGRLHGETIATTNFRCLGKNVFQLNEHRLESASSPLDAVARCVEKSGDERILLAARTLCNTARSPADRLLALDWLRRLLGGDQSAKSRVPETCLTHQLRALRSTSWPLDVSTPLDRSEPVWTTSDGAPDLVDIWQGYGFDHDVGYWLLAQLQHALPSWHLAAVELSEHLWQQRRKSTTNNFEVAKLDLEHAQYALSVGFPERARSVLLETPKLFPPTTLGDVNLPAFARVSPWRDIRREVELLMRQVTIADPRQRDLARQRLVALDPLDLDSLREATLSSTLGQRAQLALQLLEGPVATEDITKPDPPHSLLRPLEDVRLSSQLTHPLTRSKHTIRSKLADVVALVPAPDETVLKLYCERVVKADSPLLDALDRAATVLGLGHFDLYVSRGKDDVGAHAFAANGKLVLIGGQHTDPNSRHYLDARELTFAFAMELAHVRLGHARVSVPDVVRGLLSKGKQGAELAFSLLPLINGLHLGKRLGMVTAKLSLPQINKAVTAARTLESAVTTALPPERHADLSRPTEALLDAHRLEQLSADRAGLVCCGDLLAAFTAILKTRTDYVRVNATLAANGALAAIAQHSPSNPRAFDDLTLRLGHLIAFYLSDDYEELRRLTYR